MIPSFFLVGVVISTVYTFLSNFMVRIFGDDMTDLQLNSLTFKILMLEGVGEFAGGLAYVLLS